jgi:uncharacterized OB-fold protein
METPPLTYTSYQQFLVQGKLMGSRCTRCGERYLPPRLVCRRCYGDQMEWVDMPLQGKLAAFTSIHVGQTFMAAEGFDRSNPYCVGIVELADQVRVSALIIDVDARRPETIRIGTPMEAQFIPRGTAGEARTVLAFRPMGS